MPRDIAPYDFRQRTPIVLATQMTKAEYVLLPESSIPHNLIAGTLYRSACPTFAHQEWWRPSLVRSWGGNDGARERSSSALVTAT